LVVTVILAGISFVESAPAVLENEPRPVQIVVLCMLVVGPLLTLAVHEAAHVLAARRCGAEIVAVSPQLAGALPDTLYEAENPANEVRVGLAGPGATVLLGTLIGVGWWLTRDAAGDALSSVIGLMALINFGLAGVSVMPGYPFDGGRVARGFFWYLTGDLFTATKIVGYIGYVVIMAAMTVGVLLLVSGGGLAVWGFWVLMTAFMVNRSVGAGISHIYWTVNSRRLRVDDLFVGGTRRIRADTLIDDAIERLLEGYQDGPMLVVEDDVAIGLVDLASIRPVPRGLWTERRIRDVLTPLGDLPRVTSNASLRDLVELLPPDVGAVALIMRDERVIGATDRRDVVRRLQEYLAAERIEQLRRGR
jgi:Zn-dependent protease